MWGGWGGLPTHAWPLPSHFHSCPLGVAIYQDPGRGHPPPAHRCMEQAIKLTLWRLFSLPSDTPPSSDAPPHPSAHLLQQGRIKSQPPMCKILPRGERVGVCGGGVVRGVVLPEHRQTEARLWSHGSVDRGRGGQGERRKGC